ncbi:MAG: aminotransferase class I/II-fold pyridoxal phosphate-dependent enzyme [bacterium]|nr:aminotransferase class I/II-fold pyridoxal phosphate-dependent enzyme [bacterium]
MTPRQGQPLLPRTAQAIDDASLRRHFGSDPDLLPLWIAEPYIEVAPPVAKAMERRAGMGWFGYEIRPDALGDSFWAWMAARHGWSREDLRALVSPSVGTSIGVLIEQVTQPGDGVIIQPPVFTDFKPLVTSGGRSVIRNPLALSGDGYGFDLEDLNRKAADPSTTALILCNPHNPVGRVWTAGELSDVATICARHGVFVIADEIHADLTLGGHSSPRWRPLARKLVSDGPRCTGRSRPSAWPASATRSPSPTATSSPTDSRRSVLDSTSPATMSSALRPLTLPTSKQRTGWTSCSS